MEVVVGAVLTQNTSWKNVVRAIENMKNEDILDVEALYYIDEERLCEIIRPSGFFNVKSRRLKNIINVIYDKYNASLEGMMNYDLVSLRSVLLGINGIGPETADSILLYALGKPIFVVDAYTKRFLRNHKLYNGDYDYDNIQGFFMDNLPSDTYLFNEFHALIVRLCQINCKKTPECNGCPLEDDRH